MSAYSGRCARITITDGIGGIMSLDVESVELPKPTRDGEAPEREEIVLTATVNARIISFTCEDGPPAVSQRASHPYKPPMPRRKRLQ
jgi:hypothetical protein